MDKINTIDTSAATQQRTILKALKDSPKTTIELRRDCGVMQPAARVKELREHGHKINTVRMTCLTDDGIKHHGVAKYVLVKSKPSKALN